MKIFYADDDAEDREIFCNAIQQINPTITLSYSRMDKRPFEMLISKEPLRNP
jgi:hypothetical protein